MLITIALFVVWNLQISVIRSLSHDDYVDLSTSICEGQCTEITCPSTTIMKIQMVEILYGKMKGGKCQYSKQLSSGESDYDIGNYCKQILQVNKSQEVNSKCSHRSDCIVCHRKMETGARRYGHCRDDPTVAIIKYICISDRIKEEVVQANTYVDLTCAHLIDHRIIILNATLIPNDRRRNSRNEGKSECTLVDVSSFVSRSCAGQFKCQAGPDIFIPKYCETRNLQIKYSCVPESVLKVRRMMTDNSLQIDSSVPIITVKKPPEKKSVKKKTSKLEEEVDRLWIAIVSSVIGFVVLTIMVMLCWCRHRQQLRRLELSVKIKNANFSPPPSSIDKIEIDLSCNHQLPSESTLICQQLLSNDGCEFWKNTVSRCPTTNIRMDAPSCSLSAGSSSQMSAYHSDSSRGNPSTVFNYITREKPSPDQTPL